MSPLRTATMNPPTDQAVNETLDRIKTGAAVVTGVGVLWLAGVRIWRAINSTVLYVQDIGSMPSRLRRIEDHTVRLGQRFAIHLDFADYATFETDATGHCLATSHAYDRLSRRSSGESLGNGWLNAVCDIDRERVIREWRACLSDGREFHSRFSLCWDGEEPIPVVCTIRPILTTDGRAVSWFGFLERP